jgi:hypothetical protein
MHRFSSSSRTASLSFPKGPLPVPVLVPVPVTIDEEEDEDEEDEDEEILPMNPKQAFKNPSCASS